MFHVEETSPSNTLSLCDDGSAIAILPTARCLVLLKDASLDSIASEFRLFEAELRSSLCEALCMTNETFASWHLANDKSAVRFAEKVLPDGACIGFKMFARERQVLAYLQHPAVIQAAIAEKVLNDKTDNGLPRTNNAWGTGTIAHLCQQLPIKTQRNLLQRILLDPEIDLDNALRVTQKDRFDLRSVENLIASATCARGLLDELAQRLWQFDEAHARNQPRHWGAIWFLLHLVRQRFLLLPKLRNGENLIPRLLKPFYWTFFVHPGLRPLAFTIVQEADSKVIGYIWALFRELLINTNFFQIREFLPGVPHLMHLKELYGGKDRHTDNCPKLHGTNQVFKQYLQYHGRSYQDVGTVASYFGGGRRAGHHAAGGDAFSWITRPSIKKLKLYEKLTGTTQPPEFSYGVQQWAQEFQRLLPMFPGKTLGVKIDALNLFLIYLTTLGDEGPTSWWELDRAVHINGNDDDSQTFLQFLSKVSKKQATRCLRVLKQAWELAAARDGVRGKIPCPIEIEIDAPDQPYTRQYRTKRRALDPEVFAILVEEHRRNDFAFARSLGLYDRVVTGPSGESTTAFWPSVPMILDNILMYGMRISSATWQDSAEGDESWVDSGSRTLVPNPLASRTNGRAEGFLRLFRVGTRHADEVIGTHVATSKTGPYDFPFAQDETIRYVQWMRDLQIKYNRMDRPIPATFQRISADIASPGTFEMVYPLYREYDSVTLRPPTAGAIHNYWNKLCGHCQSIVNEKLGRHGDNAIILAVNGKAALDIHSLRVSTATTLLENGVDPWMVAELLGHRTLAMLYRYWAKDAAK